MTDPLLIRTGPPPPVDVPAEGRHDAVLVRWKDEGLAWCYGKELPCVRLYWQLAARKRNGYRFWVSKRFHRTLHRPSLLRRWLEAWQHRPFTARELTVGLTLDRYLWMPCHLDIKLIYRDDRDRPWVDVAALVPWDFQAGRRALTPEGVPPHTMYADTAAQRSDARRDANALPSARIENASRGGPGAQ